MFYCILALIMASSADDPRSKPAELPEVALVIPEEARPGVKAILKAQSIALRLKMASERAKAALILGELGAAGKPARGLHCRAMLGPVSSVRVAADSLSY